MRGYARAGCAAGVVPALLMNVAEPRCRDPNGCSWATRMAAVGCDFNRSMQRFGGIVQLVFRSLMSFLGAHSIALPRR